MLKERLATVRTLARDARALWVDSVWQDVRYGLRGLARNPGFTAAVVVTLGLGIGANSAIFSVVNGLMFRPLPVRDADRLTVIAVSRGRDGSPEGLSRLDMEDYRSQTTAFEDIAAYNMNFAGLTADNRAERVLLTYVTGNYFDMLGLLPSAGRLVRAGEGRVAGADPVLVLSHRYWLRRFNGDPQVVGKAVRLNGRPFTIVGVGPKGFHGASALLDVDAFAPLGMMADDVLLAGQWNTRDDANFRVLGRLRRGVSLQEAQASLEVIARRLAARYPETNKDVRPHVFRETHARPDAGAANTMPVIGAVFLGLVALVLLVACVNAAGLLLVRGTARVRELTLRTALGAGRRRLVQQLVTESLLLSLFGGVAGVLLGAWISRALAGIRLPNDLPMLVDFSFDWRVFAYAASAVLASALVAGLAPAFRASRECPADALRDGGRMPVSGAGRHRLRNALVVAQVACSLVVLVMAGLFVRSLARAQGVDLGIRPDHLLNVTMDPGQQGYDETRTASLYRDLLSRVRSLPGVESASLAHTVPFGYNDIGQRLEKEGQTLAPADRGVAANYNIVDADYQRTMGLEVIRGRWFTQAEQDDRRPVVVVNEQLAARLWPGEHALGKRLRFRDVAGSPFLEVIGVTRTGKYNQVTERPRGFLYIPQTLEYKSLRVLHVRTTGRPDAVAPIVRRELASLAPDVPVWDVTTMQEWVDGYALFLRRAGAWFAGALGLLGLALAVVGLYGVVAYTARQRTHEIGIRMALGAGRGAIVAMVVSQGVRLVVAGGVAGALMALAAGRLLSSLLFDVTPHDPLTYAAVAGLLAVAGGTAAFVPARRATRVDPTIALRGE